MPRLSQSDDSLSRLAGGIGGRGPGETKLEIDRRRVREAIIKAGRKLEADNVYGLELTNGSRVLALPGSDDSIRGLTVDAGQR